MERITISGGFHNAARVTVLAQEKNGALILSINQMRKISKAMCGIKGCICGMRHGWIIDGATRGSLADAMQEAQIAEYSARHNG